MTIDDLAVRTGLNRRLVTEWAAGQAVSGYLSYHPVRQTYELPVEQAMVLATASPSSVRRTSMSSPICGSFCPRPRRAIGRRVRVADAASFGTGKVDVVTLSTPYTTSATLGAPSVGPTTYSLRAASWVAVEPWSTDRLEDSIGNPIARLGYAVSTSLCTPTSLAQPGSYGLGNGGGATPRLQLLTEAGFEDAHVAVDTGRNLIISARADS